MLSMLNSVGMYDFYVGSRQIDRRIFRKKRRTVLDNISTDSVRAFFHFGHKECLQLEVQVG